MCGRLVAPTQLAPLVTNEPMRRLTLAQFGLVRHGTKHKPATTKLINARVEGLARSRVFAQVLVSRRGVVPVTGYFEWQTLAGTRQPFFIHAAHGEPLFLASLWTRSPGPDGQLVQSFSVITRESLGPLAVLHSRMPLTLAARDVGAWLTPEERTADQLAALLHAAPRARMPRAATRVASSQFATSRQSSVHRRRPCCAVYRDADAAAIAVWPHS